MYRRISQHDTAYFTLGPGLCCVRDANSTICMLFAPCCCHCRCSKESFFLLRSASWLVLSGEINSEDVTRHPQLLAAKQRKGFPNMVKQPGCSAWRGVSTARGASWFFSTLHVRDLSRGECCLAHCDCNNEFGRFFCGGIRSRAPV